MKDQLAVPIGIFSSIKSLARFLMLLFSFGD
jgi:hypothetical protein